MKRSVLSMFHLLFWIVTSLLVLLGFQLLSITSVILGGHGPGLKDNLLALLTTLPIGAVIFYGSYFSLNFFIKRPFRFLWLFLGYLLLILVFLVPSVIAALKSSDKIDLLEITLIIAPILYFNLFGFLFRTFIEWLKDRKLKAELERDKTLSQLELLKSKLNPHFLFNTLNNIDVMMQDDSKKASEYLKKLSEILRFMLYESIAEKIPLTTEIEYIKKYIDLQKIRTSNLNYVTFEITGDAANKHISPMILIHFIENAFKYASNKKIDNAINIHLDIVGMNLSFFCKNHIQKGEEINSGNSGLGIQLLKQKLDLIYKKAYTLNFNEENNWYIVTLEIQLDEH